jgi:hypothetical protein
MSLQLIIFNFTMVLKQHTHSETVLGCLDLDLSWSNNIRSNLWQTPAAAESGSSQLATRL